MAIVKFLHRHPLSDPMRCDKKSLIFFLVAFFLFMPQFLLADTNAAKELTALMGNIQTMQASFEQKLLGEHASAIGIRTLGKMLIVRPGKFRWEITEPNTQLVIINKDKMLSYDEDLAQVTKSKVNINQPGNPAMLLSSPVEILEQSFQIVKLKKSNQEVWFKLTPKKYNGVASSYEWLKICFIKNQLRAMDIFDNLEQTTRITFNNPIFNKEISNKKFTFTPPPKTEVYNAE
jgi:outer membrane lipoprotein carrier protein